MKNKILYLFIFIVGGLASCDKDSSADYIFDKSVNERFEELYTEYNTAFQAPENGWLGYYNPNGDTGAFSILLKFNADGSVIMHSDYKNGNANDTITYSITKKQDITLTFESWSVFHAIYETNNNNFGGEYVFNISDVSNEEITLVSKTDNGYNGDDVTTLILKPATAENWDLTDIYASAINIAGDATKSVFRNFNADGTPIASFSYDDDSRSGTLSYIKDGIVVSENTPIIVKKNGLCFIKPVIIGDRTLDCFTYNPVDGTYYDESGSLKLVYDLVPAVPLTPYAFGTIKDAARYNYMEENKSSLAFNNFYKPYLANALADHGVTIQKWYFRNLLPTTGGSYFQIYFGYGTGNYAASYFFDYEVKDDGKVYFTLTGLDGNAEFLDAAFQPLVQKIFNTNGHYLEATGGLLTYTNGTFSLINADDPSLKINFYDF